MQERGANPYTLRYRKPTSSYDGPPEIRLDAPNAVDADAVR
jgi:hypothetical protein